MKFKSYLLSFFSIIFLTAQARENHISTRRPTLKPLFKLGFLVLFFSFMPQAFAAPYYEVETETLKDGTVIRTVPVEQEGRWLKGGCSSEQPITDCNFMVHRGTFQIEEGGETFPFSIWIGFERRNGKEELVLTLNVAFPGLNFGGKETQPIQNGHAEAQIGPDGFAVLSENCLVFPPDINFPKGGVQCRFGKRSKAATEQLVYELGNAFFKKSGLFNDDEVYLSMATKIKDNKPTEFVRLHFFLFLDYSFGYLYDSIIKPKLYK